MTRQQQIYYNAVFGAMGALLGWFVAGLLPDGLRGAFFIEAVLIGAGVGCLIGAMIGVMEGAVVTRTVSRAVLGC